jgi:hypothetical protein
MDATAGARAVTLTEDERALLVRTLQNYLKELSHEIADTDNHRFRAELRVERDVLRGVLDRLSAPEG